VLQLVDDPSASLREAARVVRPGGRVVAVLATAENDPDDEIGSILDGMRGLVRREGGLDHIESVAPTNLRMIHRGHMPWQEFEGSAAEQIALIERRSYSSLFDVDEDDWNRTVEPVLDRLRALPGRDVSRRRRNRHPLVVWDVRG
ncbi:MAG: hypothetical protein QNM02_13515, partial [Acidimicrobiia bacterium]|nr:hypothetical protein [Acidimicrobiia bacterium]